MNTSRILRKLLTATAGGVVITLALQPLAKAASLSILVGDKDCFGLGELCADGTLWRDELGGKFPSKPSNNVSGSSGSYRSASDADFTDKWFAGRNITYTNSYDFNGEIPVSAELVIRTAGLVDNRGPWDVLFNSILLGQFATNTSPNAFQQVVTHIFSVPINLLTGSDNILLDINKQSLVDGYSIDYSELHITTKAKAVPESVPEPDSIMGFLTCGAFGTIYWLKRKRP
jgi:hypothetical protein